MSAGSDTLAVNVITWLRTLVSDHRELGPEERRRFTAALGSIGVFGLVGPRASGGLGLSTSDAIAVFEQLGAIDIASAATVLAHTTASLAIERHASAAVRQTWLTELYCGRTLAGIALTEDEAGSNPRAMRAEAHATAHGWRIHARKTWCGSAARAGVLVVFARTPRGITAFAVPTRADGVAISPAIAKLGPTGLDNHTVSLHGVEVDEDAVLGEIGDGLGVAQTALGFGRLAVAGLSLGASKRCVQVMTRHASRRRIATGLLGDHPHTRVVLADVLDSLAAIEALLAEVTHDADAPAELEMAVKVAASEHVWRCADTTVQLLGARGFSSTNPAAKLLRDVRFLRIGEGPSETLLAQIGAAFVAGGLRAWFEHRGGAQILVELELAFELLAASARHARGEASDPVARTWSVSALGGLALAAMLETVATTREQPRAATWARRRRELLLAAATHEAAQRHWTRDFAPQLEAIDAAIGSFDATAADRDAQLDPYLRSDAAFATYRAALELGPRRELSPEQRDRVLSLGRGPALELPRALTHQLFQAQVDRAPDRVALRSALRCMSYRQLDAQVNRLAAELHELGVRPGCFVALALDRDETLVVAALAVLACGAAFAPIDRELPAARVRELLTQLRPHAIVCAEHASDHFDCDVPIVRLAIGRDAGQTPRLDIEIAELDPAYVMFTSGSTGVPKGVVCAHGPLRTRLLERARVEPLEPDDRVLQVSVPTFDAAVWEWFAPLIAGAQLVIPDPADGLWNAARFAELLAELEITTLQLVPSQLSSLLTQPLERSLRLIFVGGERLTGELCERARARLGAQIINLYGPTEATIEVTHHRYEPTSSGPLPPIGTPHPSARLYVLDERRELVALGEAGELYIGGESIALGYLGQADATAASFVPDPFSDRDDARMYKTGDRVRFGDDGQLEFLGRVDKQIKLRGRRIEPAEIERALVEHPEVARAVIVVDEHPGASKRLLAFVEPIVGAELESGALRRFAAERLPRQLVPTVHIVERLPMSAAGKIDLRALPRTLACSAISAKATLTAAERQVARIWRDVLGAAPESLDDDFFEHGGHSLSAVELLVRLRESCSVNLRQREFFERPTPRRLIAAVEGTTTHTHSVLSIDETWHDPQRDRSVPLLVYVPTTPGPHPVVLFSHGLGGNRESYAYLGEHWAAHGYVVVHVQHPGSDTDALLDSHNPMLAAMLVSADLGNLAHRPLDLRFVIDELHRRRATHPGLAQAELGRIAVAGHSFGAYTALSLAGLRVDLPDQRDASFFDPRVAAVIALCPPADMGGAVRPEHYASVRVPTLHMTGTEDNGPMFAISPAERRFAYEHCPGEQHSFINLDDATHFAFSDNPFWQGRRIERNSAHHPLIQSLTTRFLDAYLRGDTAEWASVRAQAGFTLEHSRRS